MRIASSATSELDFTDSRGSREKFRARWIFVGLVLLGIVWFFFQLFGMNSKIVVSKETTFILEPLGEDGLPDFVAHLRNRASEGVTPENNAAVLTWHAMWPGELAQEHWLPMTEALGLKAIPSAQGSLVDVDDSSVREAVSQWLVTQYPESEREDISDEFEDEFADEFGYGAGYGPSEYGSADENEFADSLNDVAFELIDLAGGRPWRSEQCPPLADWVKNNQRPLDMLVAASKRSHYFSPSPSSFDGKDSGVLALLLPGVQGMRTGVRALMTRAMWHLGEGRHDECWQDLLACHRLARLTGQGDTIIEQLIGIAIEGRACRGTVSLLHYKELEVELAHQIFSELNDLPVTSSMMRAYDQGERLMLIDSVIRMSQGKLDGEYEMSPEDQVLNSASSLALDWNFILREGNRWYDRIVEAAKQESLQQRKAAFQQIDSDLMQLSQTIKSPGMVIGSFFSRRQRSKMMANLFVSMLVPAFQAATNAEDRSNTVLEMTRIAAALAFYRAEHNEYPEKLADMVPGILVEMPLDMYSNQPFIYARKADGGYVLYSVFANGIDDGGTDMGGEIVDGEWVEEQPEDFSYGTSDLVIRVPVPVFELPELDSEEDW